jgi:hypothetical protein
VGETTEHGRKDEGGRMKDEGGQGNRMRYCRDCKVELGLGEGVNCGSFALCDGCYEGHTPRVYNGPDDGVGESDELI